MSFEFPVRIYWEDTDAGGIVFYANYLKFFERARTEWLRSLGLDQSRMRQQSGGMFVVTETSVRYLRPARLDDLLRITARVQEPGRVVLGIAQQAFGPDGRLLAEGTIRLAWGDAVTLMPARLPAEVLQALQQ